MPSEYEGATGSTDGDTRHPMTGNEMSGSAAGGSERHTYDVVVIGAGGSGLRAAIVVALILTYDAVLAFGPMEGESAGIHMGLGTVVVVANVVLIWLYTLSCHSCRHSVGGRLRHFSKHPVRYRLWTWVSKLNTSHARYAWLSLFSVAIADFYIYLLSTGAIEDLRFF